jgi:hypothetical protein
MHNVIQDPVAFHEDSAENGRPLHQCAMLHLVRRGSTRLRQEHIVRRVATLRVQWKQHAGPVLRSSSPRLQGTVLDAKS